MQSKIELKSITKRFPGVVANDDISISIEEGEIHALAGENGAGKSTLMNILYGLYQPDEGEIFIDGKPVRFASSKDSISNHIGMVHQHFMLIPRLTVGENIMTGQEVGSFWRLNRTAAYERISSLSEQYGLHTDPAKKVRELTVTEQQRVEILKVLFRDAEILIFDEPTAVLTPQEIDEFCEILLRLKKTGKTIIFISHKLAEVMKIADRITVIRSGKVVGTVNKKETSPVQLTRMMVGRDVDLDRHERETLPNQHEILALKGISYTVNKTVKKLNNVNLTLHTGEILGIAGVDGNGQEELVSIISGQVKPDAGSILLKGKEITSEKIRTRKENGLCLIPEDRHKDGLVLDFSIAENLILGRHMHKDFSKKETWLNLSNINGYAEKMRKDFDIRTPGIDVKAGTLSGGNQQKVVIARELTRDPDVIVAVQPTRGLDIGAIEFVYETLLEQREKGKGVLLFSLELDELLSLSDRIAVIYKGEIIDVVDGAGTNRQDLGLLMLGSKRKEE